MKQSMYKTLDNFLAVNQTYDADRSTYLTCNLRDDDLKITISFVFMRDWDSIEADGYNSVVLAGKGAVFIFPCYWVSIPKELAIPYFEYIIDEFYNSVVSKWPGFDGGGCPCPGPKPGPFDPGCPPFPIPTPPAPGPIPPCGII